MRTTLRHVAAHTIIYRYRTAAENPTSLGSFIIMDYIDHQQNISRALLDPERGMDERPVLSPDATEQELELRPDGQHPTAAIHSEVPSN